MDEEERIHFHNHNHVCSRNYQLNYPSMKLGSFDYTYGFMLLFLRNEKAKSVKRSMLKSMVLWRTMNQPMGVLVQLIWTKFHVFLDVSSRLKLQYTFFMFLFLNNLNYCKVWYIYWIFMQGARSLKCYLFS